jgi:hypothetical protein
VLKLYEPICLIRERGPRFSDKKVRFLSRNRLVKNRPNWAGSERTLEMMRKREQIEMMTNMYILIRADSRHLLTTYIHEVLPPAANLERVNSTLNTLLQLGIYY